MDDYVSISVLNDFVFCPYSIYLSNVYMESDDGLYRATPQERGRAAHETTDKKTYTTHKADIMSLPVYSETLRITGKIDLYKQDKRLLIERKYQLKNIYRGQYYQLWAQYLCMREMGYEVDGLAFYEISTNKMIPVALPGESEKAELVLFIHRLRKFNPEEFTAENANKCAHCIYCNLCDKTDADNVYT